MKERPIIFSAPMVRAILEGRKWQTRRVIKPQPFLSENMGMIWKGIARWLHPDGKEQTIKNFYNFLGSSNTISNGKKKWQFCPFGIHGDRLWVRETWQSLAVHEHLSPANIPIGSDVQYPATYDGWISKHRPSIHMPRWASRITLEIADIRVEQLQDISEEDAIAEGAQYFQDIPIEGCNYNPPRWSMKKPISTMYCLSSARMAFANFINELHGGKNWNLKSHSLWDDNPWVWVIEFKRVVL